MSFKTVIDAILFYASVPKCVSCQERLLRHERAICDKCMVDYLEVKKRNCSICAKTLDRCTCTNHYLDNSYVHKLIKVYRYVKREALPSNEIIYSLKRSNRKDVLCFLSEELAAAIDNSLTIGDDVVFTNIPRRKKEAKRYGLDHAALLSKSLAKRYSAEYYQPIIARSKKPQKKTVGEERIENAKFKIKRNPRSLNGKTVIIVDDIVTTGASMGACARLLHSLGAKKIIGAVISIAYKDAYIPFDTEDRFTKKK